jgi:hypothetical protein
MEPAVFLRCYFLAKFGRAILKGDVVTVGSQSLFFIAFSVNAERPFQSFHTEDEHSS